MVTDGCFRVSLWGRIVATATVVAVVAPGQAMSNAASAALAINGTGRFFISQTVLKGRYAARVAIGNLATGREDVAALWEEIRRVAATV